MTSGMYLKDTEQKNIETGTELLVTDTLNDYRIYADDLYLLDGIIKVLYNSDDNVYDLPNDIKLNIDNLFDGLLINLYITNDQKNTKMGVSLRLSDGNIIPIVHSSLYNHSLISKTGLNEGSNEFYYAANIESFVFSKLIDDIGDILKYHSDIIPNGYIKLNESDILNSNDYPTLNNIIDFNELKKFKDVYTRASGSLAGSLLANKSWTLQNIKLTYKYNIPSGGNASLAQGGGSGNYIGLRGLSIYPQQPADYYVEHNKIYYIIKPYDEELRFSEKLEGKRYLVNFIMRV